jgi:hypothetical protein
MIWTYTKDFPWKKMTQIRQISKFFNSRSPDFYDKVPVGSQEYRKILFFFLLSYLICSQIWLNHLLDNHHLCYINKFKKRTLMAIDARVWEILTWQTKHGVCATVAFPFALKSILRQKKKLWKLKYFTMWKYNLQKIF